MNTKFWLPTYQYFIEFPARIQQADALAFAGEKDIDGILCQGVLASWGTTAVQRHIDQYLIWINSETKRIEKVEYTIREMYNFIKGAAYYRNYKNFDGILLPTKMPVESNLVKNGLLHEMRILDMKWNVVSQEELRPDSSLTIMGDEK